MMLTVKKAAGKVTHQVRGGPITVNTTGPKLYVAVSATGLTPTGTVTLRVGAKTRRGSLARGHVTIELPKFASAGKVPATIRYGGSDHVKGATKRITLTVTRG
jgi:hypothetical protein